MASRIFCITIDAHDPSSLADFWCQALDYQVTYDTTEEVIIKSSKDKVAPVVLFIAVPDSKTVKNRLHFDLAPDNQAAEVERLLGLGAKLADIGQKEVPWIVMADPEGNEFCILTPRES